MKYQNTKAIITDIEGTISSIDFVKEVLFPYARDNLDTYIEENHQLTQVKEILNEVAKLNQHDEDDLTTTKEILKTWIDEDKKIKPLKDLQGLIWQTGYENGDFQGHIYDDAYEKLTQWHEQGFEIYIYSSGSVRAQKLLYAHTKFGDINHLFAGNFDTSIGHKKDQESYKKIASEINVDANEVLFLSDIVEELEAAAATGMQILQLKRDDRTVIKEGIIYIDSLVDVDISEN